MARDISKQAFGRLKAEAKRVSRVEGAPAERPLSTEEERAQRKVEQGIAANYGSRTKQILERAKKGK